MTLARRLVELITQRGLSSRRLSAACGISPSQLSRLTRGVIQPSVSEASAIASALGIDVGELVHGLVVPEEIADLSIQTEPCASSVASLRAEVEAARQEVSEVEAALRAKAAERELLLSRLATLTRLKWETEELRVTLASEAARFEHFASLYTEERGQKARLIAALESYRDEVMRTGSCPDEPRPESWAKTSLARLMSGIAQTAEREGVES